MNSVTNFTISKKLMPLYTFIQGKFELIIDLFMIRPMWECVLGLNGLLNYIFINKPYRSNRILNKLKRIIGHKVYTAYYTGRKALAWSDCVKVAAAIYMV